MTVERRYFCVPSYTDPASLRPMTALHSDTGPNSCVPSSCPDDPTLSSLLVLSVLLTFCLCAVSILAESERPLPEGPHLMKTSINNATLELTIWLCLVDRSLPHRSVHMESAAANQLSLQHLLWWHSRTVLSSAMLLIPPGLRHTMSNGFFIRLKQLHT